MFLKIQQGMPGRKTLSQRTVLAVLLTSVLFFTGCNEAGPSVEVDGKTYTASDLKSQRAKVYDRIREEYNNQISEALKQMAMDRMLELEAKKNGKTVPDYIQSLRAQVAPPGEAEIAETYRQLKAGGQIGNESLAQVHDKIASYLMGQRGQDAIGNEIARLKKEYGYQENEGPVTRRDVAVGDDPVRNNPNGKVTIIEFSDFECPYCTRVQQTATKLRAAYGDKVKWVVKDFPLSFHPNAMGGHVAANCVLRQDKEKYWKFFDGLFAESRPDNYLEASALANLASSVGTDMTQYNKCLGDAKVQAEINEDMKEGEEVGVTGTPAFFINGRLVAGALPYEEFQRLIDAELN